MGEQRRKAIDRLGDVDRRAGHAASCLTYAVPAPFTHVLTAHAALRPLDSEKTRKKPHFKGKG
ncbi:hypothetical protein [Roseovarius tolerans]|uniref:hypothetical protein n=1 Tax=Roseovarius tolerans TaxID=74031 RepID=UPI00128DAA5F|nr:hypothetical protein [Roseovarius tolerans]